MINVCQGTTVQFTWIIPAYVGGIGSNFFDRSELSSIANIVVLTTAPDGYCSKATDFEEVTNSQYPDENVLVDGRIVANVLMDKVGLNIVSVAGTRVSNIYCDPCEFDKLKDIKVKVFENITETEATIPNNKAYNEYVPWQ